MTSFHTFFIPDAKPEIAQPMLDRVLRTPGQYSVSQNDPSRRGVPASPVKWAKRVSADWWGRAATKQSGPGSHDLAAEFVANGTGRDPGTKNATANLAFEGGVNAMTAEGFHVLIDEARRGEYDSIRFLAKACPKFDHPERVWIYLVNGEAINYAAMDPAGEPGLITGAVRNGVGLMPEIYPNQWNAEMSLEGAEDYVRGFLEGKGGSKVAYLDEVHRDAGRQSQISFTLGIGDQFRTNADLRDRASGDYMEFCDVVLQQMFRHYPELASQGVSTWKWQSSGKANTLAGPGHEHWAKTMAAMLDHYESGPGADGSARYFETAGSAPSSGGGWLD